MILNLDSISQLELSKKTLLIHHKAKFSQGYLTIIMYINKYWRLIDMQIGER